MQAGAAAEPRAVSVGRAHPTVRVALDSAGQALIRLRVSEKTDVSLKDSLLHNVCHLVK